MRRLISGLFAIALLAAPQVIAKTSTVTIWVPAELKVVAATGRIATVSRTEGNAVKFSKACAKAAGKFDTYTATVFDTGLGTVKVAEIASEKLPGKGIGIDLSSLRAEGECTDGGRKWLRFNAVVTEPDTKGAKPKPTSQPLKKEEKKKDGKGK